MYHESRIVDRAGLAKVREMVDFEYRMPDGQQRIVDRVSCIEMEH